MNRKPPKAQTGVYKEKEMVLHLEPHPLHGAVRQRMTSPTAAPLLVGKMVMIPARCVASVNATGVVITLENQESVCQSLITVIALP
jgi:hypothetical protein